VETTVNEPRVAIAGAGAVTALGSGIEPLRQALRTNISGLGPRDCAIGKTRQSVVAGWVPEAAGEQLRRDDPAHAESRAYLFAAAALAQAGRSAAGVLNSVPPARRGLVLSTTKAEIEALEKLIRHRSVSPAAQRQIQPAGLAADLAAAFAAAGPVQCISAACISGLLAIQQGAAMIRRGTADAVFVVGVDLISEFVLAGFTSLKSLDPEGCRPFDRARVGLSLGEGAGALVLARRDLLSGDAVLIAGWGSSNDANHLTGPSRDGAGLALAIGRALAKAGRGPDAVDYVNAHGTGTPYNDNMESLALRNVFGERVPPFSSSKGLLGHTLGAAGILETILCLAALEARLMPGTPRLRERDPVTPDSLLPEPRPAPGLRRILKINCGFGGTNAALVLERESP
jgi:3-oxoacyl-(acyl-carrier-protein) synthase